VAVTVKVTVSPTVGVALSTVLVTAMSAVGWIGLTAAEAESLAGVRSGSSRWLTVAVLTMVVGTVAVACSVRVLAAPTASEPTVHRPVAAT